MNKLLSFLVLCFVLNNSVAQSLIKIDGYCGLYCHNMEQAKKQFGEQVKFYNFHPGEKVASIGAQCANWEAAFASLTDSIYFYLEDIDSTYLTEAQAAFAWKYYSGLRKMPISCNYRIVIGNETNTNLPDRFFDKILVINSFHEFSSQQKMLEDISKKLKPTGILFIDETLAKKTGELHIQCKKRIYTDSEIIEIFRTNGFVYINGFNADFRNSKPLRKIFAFRKA